MMAKGEYPKRSTATVEFKAKFKELELSLRTSIENEYFDIRLIPEDEVVKGKKGKYYIVDLKFPDIQDTVFFESGKYVMSNFTDSLTKPLNNFIEDVYSYIDAGTECALFVRGSADILGEETLNAAFNPEYNGKSFHNIKYLAKDDKSDKFINSISIHKIGDRYKNHDLPFLRAAFIQHKIIENYDGIPGPNILEGEIENEIDPYSRNTLLIMYVNFKNKKFNN